jgi:glycosyltransferase involved in cell wall biosynthesis
MALGTPVVSTRKGCEGLSVTPGADILVADQPSDLASAVVEVLRSPDLRHRLAVEGRRLVQTEYDWSVVGLKLERIVARAVGRTDPLSIQV